MSELWSAATSLLPSSPSDALRLQLLVVLGVSLLVPLAGLLATLWHDWSRTHHSH